jgi:hypothetical protein
MSKIIDDAMKNAIRLNPSECGALNKSLTDFGRVLTALNIEVVKFELKTSNGFILK